MENSSGLSLPGARWPSPSPVQGLQERVGVADVRLDERKDLRRELFDSLLFDGTGAGGIEVVDGCDAVPAVQQAEEVAADEAGTAGNEDVHFD